MSQLLKQAGFLTCCNSFRTLFYPCAILVRSTLTTVFYYLGVGLTPGVKFLKLDCECQSRITLQPKSLLCTAHSRIMPYPCILPLDIKAYYLPTMISPLSACDLSLCSVLGLAYIAAMPKYTEETNMNEYTVYCRFNRVREYTCTKGIPVFQSARGIRFSNRTHGMHEML